jgi:hypothetical protein
VDRVRLHPFVSSAVVGNTYLEKTRAQLISMLRAQDEILLITAAGNSWTSGVALKVVTVGTDTFIRPSTSTDTTTTSDIFGTTLPGF